MNRMNIWIFGAILLELQFCFVQTQQPLINSETKLKLDISIFNSRTCRCSVDDSAEKSETFSNVSTVEDDATLNATRRHLRLNTTSKTSVTNGHLKYVCCNSEQNHSVQNFILQLPTNSQIDELFLNGQSMEPMLFLKQFQIESISIYNYEFNSLISDLQSSMTNSLQKLYLYDSKVPKYFLDQFVQQQNHLETLMLDNIEIIDNNVKEVLGYLFTKPFAVGNMLKVFSMINIPIGSLTSVDLLYETRNLRMLTISQCKLKSIDNLRFFPKLASNLWYLDLSYNRLDSLPLEWEIPSTVTHLVLSGNQFVRIGESNFILVWQNLKEFWFNENQLFECESITKSWQSMIRQFRGLAPDWTCFDTSSQRYYYVDFF